MTETTEAPVVAPPATAFPPPLGATPPVPRPPAVAPGPAPATPTAADVLTAGPSTIFSADAPVMAVDLGAPMLPADTPAVPSAGATAPNASPAFDMQEFLGEQSTARNAPPKRRGRWFGRLILVGLVGAGAWFGTKHGPELYDEYVRDRGGDGAPAEVAAPMAFPNVNVSAAPIRTAEFTLTGLFGTSDASYTVTTDFETDLSQVDISRVAGPDLQILTFADDAMIRRAGSDQWYLVERGQFPLDGRLDRSDWVRTLDEMLPSDVRDGAVIDASTESTIAGVPTRHLVLTVDPSLLAATSAASAPLNTEISPVVGTTAQIEIWVDGQGLIRQVTGAPQLGAATITVERTSPEAWIPEYPPAEAIAPLTASALVDLGI